MKRIIIAIVSASFFLISQNVTAQPKAVDLGLSVKWASCNVGANSPEEYGDYFAWGETSVKKNYSWSTLKYCTDNDGDQFSKYVPSDKAKYWSGNGAPDNRTRLSLSDDAARANWGGSWRMPTVEEWTELRIKCTWTWTTWDGINGYEVVSKINGNSIFLPAAGSRSGTAIHGSITSGRFWSSSLSTYDPSCALSVRFDPNDVHWGGNCSDCRYDGLSIRPVSE